MNDGRQIRSAAARAKSHMPETLFYEKFVPALLIFMGIVMSVLVLIALAVMLGFVHF
jgi:TRAP-type C4-dicarboxylate transport system permease small subunit